MTICRSCGATIYHVQNPHGPEVWAEEPEGIGFGCFQAAWDAQGGIGDEPAAPYPPHVPEEN